MIRFPRSIDEALACPGTYRAGGIDLHELPEERAPPPFPVGGGHRLIACGGFWGDSWFYGWAAAFAPGRRPFAIGWCLRVVAR